MDQNYKTFRIGFTHADTKQNDETEFDVLDPVELLSLFIDFVNENDFSVEAIQYVEEVPYDGDEA